MKEVVARGTLWLLSGIAGSRRAGYGVVVEQY